MACGPFEKVTVTGSLDGSQVWGSNPYSDDSDLNRAAVHAGIVAVGETAEIEFYDVQEYASYTGTTANGITTSPWGSPYCGFRIRKAAAVSSIIQSSGPFSEGQQYFSYGQNLSYGAGPNEERNYDVWYRNNEDTAIFVHITFQGRLGQVYVSEDKSVALELYGTEDRAGLPQDVNIIVPAGFYVPPGWYYLARNIRDGLVYSYRSWSELRKNRNL